MDLAGSWDNFGVCIFNPFSSLRCSTHLDTESLHEARSFPEGKWQSGGGVEPPRYSSSSWSATGQRFIQSVSMCLSSVSFYLFLYHPCPWCKDAKEQELSVLRVGLTSVCHAFCPRILNVSLRETQINIKRLLIKEPYQVSGTSWYAAAQWAFNYYS